MESLRFPIPALHLAHSSPRTLPVSWQWSTLRRWRRSSASPQIAHSPSCLSWIALYCSRVIPYFLRSRLSSAATTPRCDPLREQSIQRTLEPDLRALQSMQIPRSIYVSLARFEFAKFLSAQDRQWAVVPSSPLGRPHQTHRPASSRTAFIPLRGAPAVSAVVMFWADIASFQPRICPPFCLN
jgi:hypothetical protein